MRRSPLSSFWCARPATYSLLSLLAAAAPGCDDPDTLLQVDIDDDLADEVDSVNSVDGVAAPTPDASLPPHPPLPVTNGPQTSKVIPQYTLLSPIRMDDLKPNHFPVVSGTDDPKWHDITIQRFDGAWSNHQPDMPPGEPNQTSWGTPLYAGVDGEVMGCWRTAPYDVNWDTVWHKLPLSGNNLIIKTRDGMWVHYAHLAPNTIPEALCPKVSVNDGYMAWESLDRFHPDNSINKYSCASHSNCVRTEQYIPAGSRPRVLRGQFIGRMGAVGNASTSHVHMRVGTTDIDAVTGVDRAVQDDFHIVFENTWQALKTGATTPITWTPSTGTALQDAATLGNNVGDTLFWPGHKREETYSRDYRLSKYSSTSNGVDLLCHDTDTGTLHIDGNATPVVYGGTEWTGSASWCTAATARLHTGDFNGDGRTDILCHDSDTGVIKIDHGVHNPVNGITEFTGVDYTRPGTWCNWETALLLIGNFDSDTKDDLLCHDHATGERWLDRASNTFGTIDQHVTTPWCKGHYGRLHVGQFDPFSAGDDLLCHDTLTGNIFIDATPVGPVPPGAAVFGNTDTFVDPWCYKRGQRLFTGNVVTVTSYDELICHDSDTGQVHINVPSGGDYPGTSSSSVASGHCTDPYDRVKIGDVNGDFKPDLVCFNQRNGTRSVDYAATETSTGGLFAGAEWTSTDSGWCSGSNAALH